MVSKSKIVGFIIAGIVGVIISYTASPLFFDVTVDESMPEGVIASSLMGSFVGVGDGVHDAAGNVLFFESNDGSKFLRFEEFLSTNGPDLYVYLATDENASDFIDLGRLKGNIGNQNYLVPPGVDLREYDTVLIWCKQFSVLFGSAQLS